MGLDAQLGLEILEVTAQVARGRLRVDERHLQPMGLLHGGVHAACAEALASYGAVAAARQRDPDAGAVGLENHTSFVRAVRSGAELRIEAVPVHAGAVPSSGRWRSATTGTGSWPARRSGCSWCFPERSDAAPGAAPGYPAKR